MITDLKDLSWQVSEEEYREDKRLSYSNLSTFRREGFEKLDTLFDPISGPGLLFGSYVDALLTETFEEVQDKYVVINLPSITDSKKEIAETIYDVFHQTNDTISSIEPGMLIGILNDLKFQTNWKPQTRINAVIKDCEEYYMCLVATRGKTIITKDVHEEAVNINRVMREHPGIGWVFNTDEEIDALHKGRYSRYFQLKFKGEFENIPIKCMLDLIIVDHENKLITPYDIKTSSFAEWGFAKTFIYWSYDIQARMYWYILKQNLAKHPKYKDYTLQNFRFIVVSKTTLTPLIWEFEDCDKYGDLEYNDGKFKLKDWRETLRELRYYLANKPPVPLGVEIDNINSITNFLKNNE